MSDAKSVIQPIQNWLLSEGRCSACGNYLKDKEKRRINSHFVVTCTCAHAFEYWPDKNYFQKAFLVFGD